MGHIHQMDSYCIQLGICIDHHLLDIDFEHKWRKHKFQRHFYCIQLYTGTQNLPKLNYLYKTKHMNRWSSCTQGHIGKILNQNYNYYTEGIFDKYYWSCSNSFHKYICQTLIFNYYHNLLIGLGIVDLQSHIQCLLSK